jgi:predicted amidohydrolase YtcJ
LPFDLVQPFLLRSWLPALPAIAAAVLCAANPGAAAAQEAELVVINAKVATLDGQSRIVQGLAVREGRIAAVGSTADVRKLAGPRTRIVDAGGRTVIPGLIDSHMHAVRAALSYSVEVNWIDARTIPEAMARLRSAAERSRPGAWLVVAGGWTEQQFEERRRPTPEEVLAAAPDHPVWIQLF